MTRGSDNKPTRRVLATAEGEFVVELRERTVAIRPKGSRRGGPSEVVVTPTSVYTRALLARTESELREKRKARGGKIRVRRTLL